MKTSELIIQKNQAKPHAREVDLQWDEREHDLKDEDTGDVLVQFRSHLHQVEDLNARLKFALNEVHYVLQRRK